MTPRQRQRRNFIVLLFGASAIATALVLFALEDNLLFFYSPSQVVEALPPHNEAVDAADASDAADDPATKRLTDRLFNLGGMVVDGSVTRDKDNPTVFFALTDYAQTVTVRYTGILPDLFREGQGIVATGKMQGDLFVAERVLAKHDENYMPPEIAESLKKPNDGAPRQTDDPIGIPATQMSRPK